ncbi:hypothetical protein BDW59DRAFT_175955 [Aspergillus cavernicola]|uniref:Uncharacterized protein n=1 Tax=Aspergillus cavernicola TaxID=176166 RepID=A0ABR4HKL9_9EURO
MDLEDISQWFSNQQATQAPLIRAFSQYLTVSEGAQIFDQFQSNWIRNGQVLWSGIPLDRVQEWAAKHHLQTLTIAMGPLMDKKHPDCLKSTKNPHEWSWYIRGASAIFAWQIARFEKVILLSFPPPQQLHPSGLSNYQSIEEPIIKGRLGHCAVQQIIMVHSTITESKEFLYEIWPADKSSTWIKLFGLQNTSRKWRPIGQCKDKLRLKELIAHSGQHVLSTPPTNFFSIILRMVFLLVLARFTPFILMGILCALVDRSLRGIKVSQCCQLEQKPKGTEKPIRAIEAKRKDQLEFISGKIIKTKQRAQEKKAQAKVQKKAQKKCNVEKKAQAKVQEKAQKKHKIEKKAQAKAQKKAQKKYKATNNIQL